uniref:Collectrin, amino acid transport regulator n=1 Tax=Callithrix jacchus TaxID=9483 RepID=A0A8I3WC46_CALJA
MLAARGAVPAPSGIPRPAADHAPHCLPPLPERFARATTSLFSPGTQGSCTRPSWPRPLTFSHVPYAANAISSFQATPLSVPLPSPTQVQISLWPRFPSAGAQTCSPFWLHISCLPRTCIVTCPLLCPPPAPPSLLRPSEQQGTPTRAENAFKVRLSIRTALGDKAYAWDTNEEYLFKAMVAFSMRKVPNREATEISHVLLCNVTQRVSFWFVVTDSSKNHTLPAVEVQSAIRMNRNRINNAFSLNDQTLEFLKIPSTLAPPTDPSVPIWIIIFGVIFCIVIVAITLLILSGIRQRRRKNKEPSEVDDAEDKCENMITIENGIPCDPLDTKGGHINDAFMTEDERLTPL